jgi:hypothetical protein
VRPEFEARQRFGKPGLKETEVAIIDVTRGLSELRRQMRKSRHTVRDYNGRTQMFIGGPKHVADTPERELSKQVMIDAGNAWRVLAFRRLIRASDRMR